MLQCQPLLKQLEPLHMLPLSCFRLEYSRAWILCIPNSKPLVADVQCLQVLSAKAPGRAILHRAQATCRARFYILSCPNWPMNCMNYFLFNLFKGLLLLRAPFEIILLPGHLAERAYTQIIIWNVRSPKADNA